MNHNVFCTSVVMVLAVTLLTACGAPPAPGFVSPSRPWTADSDPPVLHQSAPVAQLIFPDIETAAFSDPTVIDNPYFPLEPGMQYLYEGFTRDGSRKVPHRKIVTVTDLNKEVAGIDTIVTYVQDYRGDDLLETEIAFYAQDDEGNVWFLGEYPEVYAAGELADSQAWIAGHNDAQAGIVMTAEPEPDRLSYAQGWGPDLNWTDRRRIVALGQEICAPAGCFTDVLVAEEYSQDKPHVIHVKFYAPGVGEVKSGWSETLELISLTELSPEDLVDIHEAALKLEASALAYSKDIYGLTVPIESGPDPADVAEFWELDSASFVDSATIDNLWMPLQPGARWVYEGTALDDEGQPISRRIEFTVTGLTKQIAGVQTVVAWIVDYNDDEAIEKEIAFYAQDAGGNIWYLGEYPEEYEEGQLVTAQPWIHGMEEALAGIKMLADPQPGVASYYQGWAPAVDWSDYSIVDQVGAQTCVPVGCHEDVLVIAESSLGETDAYQLKYYSPTVGEVRVGWRGEDMNQEELELIEFVQLSPEQLEEIHAMARELEQRAYEFHSGVYGATSPME